jgi:hypothetical protein
MSGATRSQSGGSIHPSGFACKEFRIGLIGLSSETENSKDETLQPVRGLVGLCPLSFGLMTISYANPVGQIRISNPTTHPCKLNVSSCDQQDEVSGADLRLADLVGQFGVGATASRETAVPPLRLPEALRGGNAEGSTATLVEPNNRRLMH